MDAQEYAKDFLEGVRSEAAATGEGKCAVFVRNVAQQLVDAEVLQILKAPFILEQAVETGNSESMDISSMNLIWQ